MNNRPKLIGITGGIGSGKSIVCRIFECLGIPTYYADDRAKWLMTNNETLRQKIITKFGSESYLGNQLNRQHIAKLAFNNKEILNELNSIVHPEVGKDFANWVTENSDKPYLLKEAALIFEAGSYKQLDQVITVYTNIETRVERVLQRDPERTKDQVLAIIEKQMPEEEKIQKSDYKIDNNGQLSIIKQVYELDQSIRGL